MNRIIKNITLISIINILFLSPSYCQENEGKHDNKLGFGVIIGRGSKIFFPILITPKLRLEPEISYNENEYKKDDYESEYIALSVGMGVLSLVQTEKTTTYYGFRFGYTSTSNINEHNLPTWEGTSEITQDGYYLAPVIGAEYLFAKRFSVGPEISINYTSTNGKETRDDSNNNTSSGSLLLNAGVLLRFYF